MGLDQQSTCPSRPADADVFDAVAALSAVFIVVLEQFPDYLLVTMVEPVTETVFLFNFGEVFFGSFDIRAKSDR